MLNELRELDLCLQNAGISRVDLHKNFKPCRKNGITCWVYIDSEGSISDIAVVPSKEVTAVRKWEKAAGISFPAFNVPPLLVLNADLNETVKKIKKAVKIGKQTKDDIDALSGKAEWLWNDGDKCLQLNKCLKLSFPTGSNSVIPIAMKIIMQQIDRPPLFVGNLPANRISTAI